MRTQIVTYSAAGVRGSVLPDALEYTPVMNRGEVSTLTLQYPRAAVNSGLITQDLECAFEVHNGTAWVEPFDARFTLIDADEDYLDEMPTIRYTFENWGARQLSGQHVLEAGSLPVDADGKVQFLSANAGQILGTLITNAEVRGWAGVDTDFTSSADSAAQPWNNVVTIAYEKKLDLEAIEANLYLQGLFDGAWQGRTRRIFNAGTELARDLTTGAEPVRLTVSDGHTGAPHHTSNEDRCTHVRVIGEEGGHWDFTNGSSVPGGTRWIVIEMGGVTDQGTAALLANIHLEAGGAPKVSYTAEFEITDGMKHRPFLDYRVGDWVFAQRGTEFVRLRVATISVTQSRGGLSGFVVLGDRVDDILERFAKRMNGITGGTAAGGSGVRPAPEGPDRRILTAPTGLVVQPDAFIDDNGNPRGGVVLNWAHDGKDTGGKDATDLLDGFSIQYRINAVGEPWKSLTSTGNTSVAFSPLLLFKADGVTPEQYGFRVRANGDNGLSSAWSAVTAVIMQDDTTPPPVPYFVAANLKVWLRSVEITWNGKGFSGGTQVDMPRDFEKINVYRGTSPTGPWTLVGSSYSAGFAYAQGEMPIGSTWFALTAADRSGNESARSVVVECVAAANVDLAKITGVLDAAKVQITNAGKIVLESGAELGQKLSDSDTALAGAQGRLDTAEVTLTETFPQRFTLVEQAASAASQDAADAKTDAATAQTAADAANAEAARLAGITGRVIYQSTAPTGANGDANNLWIRSTDNKPHRWNPASQMVSKWEVVTDKAATDAAAAAATAQTKANKAEQDAAAAKSRADLAVTNAATADGKAVAAAAAASAAQTAADAARAEADAILARGANLLRDGGFESGEDSLVVTGIPITVVEDVTQARHGSFSLKLDLTNTGAETVNLRSVPVIEGRTYRVGVWAKATEPTLSRNFGVPFYWRDTAGTLLNTNWPELYFFEHFGENLVPGEYVYLESDTTPPAGAVEMDPRIYIAGGTAQGPVYLDDITFMDVTDALKAEAKAATAQTAADAAKNAADTAQAAANAAQGTANTAVTNASTAQTAADAANSAASTAQTKANKAETDAATAAGIANGKGKVLTQTAAPAAADRNANTLWIDITGGANTPKRWTTGTTWVAVTDKAATDAAAASVTAQNAAATAQTAANTAQARADDAHTLAGTAQTTADLALTSANGKNTRLGGLTAPAGDGGTVGDSWQQFTDSTRTVVKGRWSWDGDSWNAEKLSHEVHDSIDLGSLTVIGQSTLSDVVAIEIAARSGQFVDLDVGQISVTGTANIQTGVAESFFAKYFVGNKIVASQVLIGPAANPIVDPFFEDELVKATRAGLSNMTGGWRRDTSLNLNWYGGSEQPTAVLKQFYFHAAPGLDTKDSYLPVRSGEQWKFRVKVNSTGGGARLISRAIYKNGTQTSINGGWEILGWDAGSGVRDLENILTVPDDVAYVALYVQFEETATTCYVYGGADFRPMTDGTLLVDGTVQAVHITASEAMSAKLGRFLTVETDMLAANAVTADKADIGSLTAAIVTANVFNGKVFNGGEFNGTKFIGGSFYTSNTAPAVYMDKFGFRAYDANVVKIFEITTGTSSRVYMSGRYDSGKPGEPGVSIIPFHESSSGDVGVFIPENTGILPGHVTAGMWTYGLGGSSPLFLRGRNGGNIETQGHLYLSKNPAWAAGYRNKITSRSDIDIESPRELRTFARFNNIMVSDEEVQLFSGTNTIIQSNQEMRIFGQTTARITSNAEIRTVSAFNTRIQVGSGKFINFAENGFTGYNRTITASANLYIHSDGNIFRTSSTSDDKLIPEPMTIEADPLGIELFDWVDRGMAERYAESIGDMGPLTEDRTNEIAAMSLGRMPGFLAQQVEEAGFGQFVTRGIDGETTGVMESRLWMVLIPEMRKQREEQAWGRGQVTIQGEVIQELKNEIEQLKGTTE